jgi:hypothetical protein
MEIVTAFLRTIAKMFAADLWLSLTAVAVVAGCGVALRLHVLPAESIPFLLAAGVTAALIIGVARGARPGR